MKSDRQWVTQSSALVTAQIFVADSGIFTAGCRVRHIQSYYSTKMSQILFFLQNPDMTAEAGPCMMRSFRCVTIDALVSKKFRLVYRSKIDYMFYFSYLNNSFVQMKSEMKVFVTLSLSVSWGSTSYSTHSLLILNHTFFWRHGTVTTIKRSSNPRFKEVYNWSNTKLKNSLVNSYNPFI